MAEPRFRELLEELLQAGVAPRHARRACMELQSHYGQLVDEEATRAADESQARSEAHRRLGTNDELVRRFAAQPELRAWSRRWPSLCFAFVPPLVFLAAGLATLFGILAIAESMRAHLHRVHIRPDVTLRIDLAAQVILLWCLPLSVAAAFCSLAARRRVALRWPITCILVLSIVASLCNVAVSLTGGPDSGQVGAGFGISPESLPGQSLHAAALSALSMVLLWTLRRTRRHHILS